MNQSAVTGLQKWGLVPLRLVVGLTFLMHGWQKLYAFGPAQVADILLKLGIPMPSFFAIVLIAVECLGGLAIVLGVFARWASILLAIDMTVAILVARMAGGFFIPNGFEFELVLWGSCLTFAALGSGELSLDRMFGRSSSA